MGSIHPQSLSSATALRGKRTARSLSLATAACSVLSIVTAHVMTFPLESGEAPLQSSIHQHIGPQFVSVKSLQARRLVEIVRFSLRVGNHATPNCFSTENLSQNHSTDIYCPKHHSPREEQVTTTHSLSQLLSRYRVSKSHRQ